MSINTERDQEKAVQYRLNRLSEIVLMLVFLAFFLGIIFKVMTLVQVVGIIILGVVMTFVNIGMASYFHNREERQARRDAKAFDARLKEYAQLNSRLSPLKMREVDAVGRLVRRVVQDVLREEGGRSRWRDVEINMFFFVLGIIVAYVLRLL
jgi:hypothetical protein